MGCGWEPRVAHATPWTPPDWDDEPPATCVGYTHRLPEVNEIAEARFYLKHGSLSSYVRGDLPENLRVGIRILENAEIEATNWNLKNK